MSARDPVEATAARLRRIVRDAKRAGVVLVADAENMAIRVLRREEMRAADLREVGTVVEVEGGCGGSAAQGGAEYGIH